MARSILPCAALVIALAGCASTGTPSEAHRPLQPDALGLRSDASTEWPKDTWWTAFGDSALNDLVARALAANPDLRAAEARVARAESETDVARASTRPNLNGRASATREHFSGNDIYPRPIGGSTRTLGSATLNGSWELDFFGRNQAALETALGRARATQADAAAARSLLASRVAATYFDLGRLVAARDVAVATREQRENIRKLVADRVRAGLDTNVELRQAEGFVPQQAQEVAALDAEIELARHALAALLGEGPEATATLAPKLADAAPLPAPTALPAELLGRRADIVAARARVESAQAGVAEARAAFYPNVDLTALVGFSSLGLSRLVEAGSRTGAVGPALTLPIFEGGRLRANLRGRNSDVDAAVASYDAALVGAVREVADAVTQIRAIDRRRTEQRAATAAAESAFDLATQRYRAGLGTYLVVLTAETNLSAQRRLATDLDGAALQAQVALARALGGGYVAAASAPAPRAER